MKENYSCKKCDITLFQAGLSSTYGEIFECPQCKLRYISNPEHPRIILKDYKVVYYNLTPKTTANNNSLPKRKKHHKKAPKKQSVIAYSYSEPVNKDLLIKYKNLGTTTNLSSQTALQSNTITDISSKKAQGNTNAYNQKYNIFEQEQCISIYDIVIKTSFKQMKEVKEQYDIEPVIGIINITNTETKRINLYYNIDEDIYFGYSNDFENLDLPHCRVLDYTDYIKKSNFDLQPTSLLYSYGYKITQTSPSKRKAVLIFVLDHNIMTWKEIINHLEFLIKLNKNKPCIYYWKRDIDFIREYVNANPEIINVKI